VAVARVSSCSSAISGATPFVIFRKSRAFAVLE
jgi:hypothetical protein